MIYLSPTLSNGLQKYNQFLGFLTESWVRKVNVCLGITMYYNYTICNMPLKESAISNLILTTKSKWILAVQCALDNVWVAALDLFLVLQEEALS